VWDIEFDDTGETGNGRRGPLPTSIIFPVEQYEEMCTVSWLHLDARSQEEDPATGGRRFRAAWCGPSVESSDGGVMPQRVSNASQSQPHAIIARLTKGEARSVQHIALATATF